MQERAKAKKARQKARQKALQKQQSEGQAPLHYASIEDTGATPKVNPFHTQDVKRSPLDMLTLLTMKYHKCNAIIVPLEVGKGWGNRPQSLTVYIVVLFPYMFTLLFFGLLHVFKLPIFSCFTGSCVRTFLVNEYKCSINHSLYLSHVPEKCILVLYLHLNILD